jgi:hypothetical protein
LCLTLIFLTVIFSGLTCQASADSTLRFNHQLSLNPVPSLPGVITFVGQEGGGRYRTVRALLVLDGELLAVSLVSGGDGKTHRGSFPTPKSSLSYQFQVLTDDGGSLLSDSFEVSPVCQGYLPGRQMSDEMRRALFAQQQRQRLLAARDLLIKFRDKLEP